MRIWTGTLLIVAACQSPTAPLPRAATEAAQASPESVGEAGLYFRNGYIRCSACAGGGTQTACETQCPTPNYVAADGPFDDAAEATAALARATRQSLAPGFPFAAAGADLGLEGGRARSAYIVYGFFRTSADAAKSGATAHRLLSDSDHMELRARLYQAEKLPPLIVQIGARGAVAYSAASLRPYREKGVMLPKRDELLAKLRPACQLPPHHVSVLADGDVDSVAPDLSWDAIRCPDGALGYVIREHTRRQSIVFERGGIWYLRQVVDVSCDQATYKEWHWRNGKREKPRLLAAGSC